TAHVQVSWYAFSGGDDGWLPLFRATGGTIVHGALSDFSAAVNDVSQFYFQVDWASRVPSSGFVISRAALSDLQGHVLLAIPDVAASPRSEEHTSELQSLAYLVCRLLLEKKNSQYFCSLER